MSQLAGDLLPVVTAQREESRLGSPSPLGGSTLMTSSKPNHLSKVPPPNTILLRVRASIYESEKDSNLQSILPAFHALLSHHYRCVHESERVNHSVVSDSL